MFVERPVLSKQVGRPRRLVCGIGINDAPYLTTYVDAQGKEHRCPFYQKWRSLLQRVASKTFKVNWPTYNECTIEPAWLSFMAFRAWMQEQDWQDKELDKDLLVQGNKHYGPETCVFVNQALNKLLCLKGNARGDLPLGVSYTTIEGRKYITAYCSQYGQHKNLGYFDTIEEAAAAYKRAKMAHIAELAANEPNPKIKEALLRLDLIHYEMVHGH